MNFFFYIFSGGWGSSDGPLGGNWGGPFAGNFNPGAMGFGGFGPGFGGFGPGFGFNPFAQMAGMGAYSGAFGPGFGFGFGGFGPGGGAGDRGNSVGDSGRSRGSGDYANSSDQDGKGSDSSSRDRSSAYPGITGYSSMMGQNWPGSYPSVAGGGTGSAVGSSVADLKGAAGASTIPVDAFAMGTYCQMNSSFGPCRTGGAWSVGSDGTNSSRMYKPY